MQSPPAPARRHLLAIEHDANVRHLFHDALTGARYQVSTMDYVDKSFPAIVQLAPDLILYDYLVDGALDGWAFLQRLRTDRQTQHIPVVLCSAAVPEVQSMNAQLTALRVPVVIKPFTLSALEATLAAVLSATRGAAPAAADAVVTA